MSDKKIVGWAIRSATGDTWVGPNHGVTYYDWKPKCERKLFKDRIEAIKFFWRSGMTTTGQAAIIRITRREKPKKYYVKVGPFPGIVNAQAFASAKCYGFPLTIDEEKCPC